MNAIQECVIEHYKDENGNPAGGIVKGVGLSVQWQNGPLGRGDDRKEPNGAFVETLISVAMDRLKFYNEGKFKCEENNFALIALKEALFYLNKRTERREKGKTEGTHEGS